MLNETPRTCKHNVSGSLSLCVAPDPGLVFQASLTSAQVLLPGSQASLSSLLLEGHSLLVLAAVMFAPGGIDQVTSEPPGFTGNAQPTCTCTSPSDLV